MIHHGFQVVRTQVIGNIVCVFLKSDIDNCGPRTGFKKRDEAIKLLIKAVSNFNFEGKTVRRKAAGQENSNYNEQVWVLRAENWSAKDTGLFIDQERCTYVICHGLGSSRSETQDAFDIHFFSESRNLEIFWTKTGTPLYVDLSQDLTRQLPKIPERYNETHPPPIKIS